ncbi:AGE family epimerase/isomerase [bacterium]|nr:AGE family epimerase/isomerase [bacterium]
MNTVLDSYADIYRSALVSDCIPFWEKNCPDREYGGYFDCLGRDGSVYDSEKFMWMQWRKVWMFCELYNKLEPRKEWLDLAKLGYDFLTKHGRDEKGRYYFSLARDGRPAMAAYSVFSDCFAVMGSAAYYRATGDEDARKEALRAFDNYLLCETKPKGEWTKEMEGIEPMKALGFYMMKANLMAVLDECIGGIDACSESINTVRMVMDLFWNPEFQVMFENVRDDRSFDLDSMRGRHLNPGHAIEAMWFIMNIAARAGENDLVQRAADIILAELKKGWDPDHGGIFYFMDVLGKPHLELQWDMKLWWVHNEALIATAMAYKLTGSEESAEWFKRIHDWAWERFPDPEYGEWFGYLNRYGEPTHMLKGGKWKSFFHLPRMLFVCSSLFSNTYFKSK